ADPSASGLRNIGVPRRHLHRVAQASRSLGGDELSARPAEQLPELGEWLLDRRSARDDRLEPKGVEPITLDGCHDTKSTSSTINPPPQPTTIVLENQRYLFRPGTRPAQR